MAELDKTVVRKRVLELLNERTDTDPAQLLMTIKDDIEKMIKDNEKRKYNK